MLCSNGYMNLARRSHWRPYSHLLHPDGYPVVGLSPTRLQTADVARPVDAVSHDGAIQVANGSSVITSHDMVNLPACRQCPQPDVRDHLRMSSESANPDTRPTTDQRAPEKSSAATSFSQFLSKIFEQLSISAWLPAVMLVGNGAVLLQLYGNRSFNIALAVRDLAAKPLGTITVLVFAVILATMVMQAFEFEVIRLLEGYLDSTRGVIQAFMAARIRRHERKRSKLVRKLQKANIAAFEGAKAAMRDTGAYDASVLDGLQQEPVSEKEIGSTEVPDWRLYSPSEALYKIDSISARLEFYPQDNRLMPTRLGNVLRVSEDKIELEADENLEGFVIRHFDELPSALKEEHGDYRTRLDMYCCLVLVFLVLAVISVPALIRINPVWGTGIAVAIYGTMAYVSYEAAIASARGYGGVLQEIAQYLERQRKSTENGAHSAFTRIRALLHRNLV